MQMTEQTAMKVGGASPQESSLRVLAVNVRPKLDPITGEKIVDEKWVTYRMMSNASQGNTIEEKLNILLDVGDNDDPEHLPTQILKARAHAVISQIQMIENGNSALPNGHMRLEDWGALSSVHVTALKANDIHSVQQLRDTTESRLAQLPSGINPLKLREMARAYLVSQQDGIATEKLAEFETKLAASEARAQRLEALLEKALDRLADQPDDTAEKRKGGRKPLPRDADGNIIREANEMAYA